MSYIVADECSKKSRVQLPEAVGAILKTKLEK